MELNRRIKILHVVFSLEPGGLENGIVNVARALDPGAFEVEVCCLERGGRMLDRLPATVKVHVLTKRPGFSARTVCGLASILHRAKPDLVHSHNLGPLIYSSLATGLGLRCPILHSEHGQLPADQLSPKRMRQRRHFFRFCRKVHTVSKTLRRQLIELGFSQDKIVAVPNGVDTDYFSPGISRIARRELRLPPGGPVLGIVGRLAPSKRHDVMLAAFEQFNRERPEAQLLVVGGGPEEERIIRLARSNKASDRIHLAGFQKDLRPYYRAMHLLLAPSTVEGLSNVILESMSCGVPVLAHTACGTSELIESDVNGFAADLENSRSILQQLQHIFAAPGRLTTIASRARNSVVKTFLLANMVKGYERLYRESARKEY